LAQAYNQLDALALVYASQPVMAIGKAGRALRSCHPPIFSPCSKKQQMSRKKIKQKNTKNEITIFSLKMLKAVNSTAFFSSLAIDWKTGSM